MLGVLPIVMENNKNLSLVPVREYCNADSQKEEILKENKGKAGIYLFTHKESGKMYIGSAKNLRVRFMQYFNPNHLERKNSMYIYRAILKHGMSKFSLAEYCEPEKCIEREDFYISSFKPQYNILLKAGSSLGFIHSLETRKKMSISQKAFDRTGEKNPMYGVPVSEETRVKLLEKQKDRCQKIEVLDLESNETISYYSIREAARVLGIKQNRITMYFLQNQKSPYKGRYIFKKIK